MQQTNWISDNSGNILVDKTIHFEKLEIEFNQVLEKLGKNTTLPHVKKSKRENYRKYYDEESIVTVQN